jgi:chromosome segregation ATPase
MFSPAGCTYRPFRDVTIPGKGGRPRKWRSDADRARAYRARLRGEPEPAQLAQILDDSDQLATARQQLQRLGELIAQLRQTEQSLRAELTRTRRALDAERSYTARLLEANRSLQQQVTAITAESVLLRTALARLPTTPTPPTPPAPPMQNRAERRRTARNLQRPN